jgi:hypothetical protein
LQTPKPTVGIALLKEICNSAGFPTSALNDVLAAGSFDANELITENFLALASGMTPGAEDITGTMAAYLEVCHKTDYPPKPPATLP